MKEQSLFEGTIPCGFPSPAEDFLSNPLDLNSHLVSHPAATFFVRVEGDSMQNAGILSGDLLVVDRALSAREGDVVVAVVHGEFTVKRLKKEGDNFHLVAENPKYPKKMIDQEEIQIWGVVTHAIHTFRR